MTKKRKTLDNTAEQIIFDKYKINKGDVIGYLVVEPEDLKIQYETKEEPSHPKKKHLDNYLPEGWQKC